MPRFHLLVLLALFCASAAGAGRLEAQAQTAEPATAEADSEVTEAGGEPEEDSPPARSRRRPRLDSSNTGYVDNAIVGTGLRLRYSSAFDADRPDRAELIYGKCLCFSGFGQDAASPGPAADLDFAELELRYEHAFGRRASLFVEVPFRSVDLRLPAGFEEVFGLPDVEESGLGDVRAGFKYALLAEPERYLTFQLRTYFASGDAAKALGTDHASIEPAILYHRTLSHRWAAAAEARYWHPLAGSSDPATGASDPDSPVGRIERIPPPLAPPDGADGPDPAVRNDAFAGDVLRLGVGVSRETGRGRLRWAPVVELVGWYFIDGYVTPGTDLAVATARRPDGSLANPPGYVQEADNDTVVNLKLGTRVRGGFPGSVYLGYGLALTDDVLYEGVFRFEYRIGLGRRERPEAERLAPTEAAPIEAPAASPAPEAGTARPPAGAPAASQAAAPTRSPEEAVATPRETEMPAGRAAPRAAPAPEPSTGRPAVAAADAEPTADVTPAAPAANPEDEVLAAVRRWSEAWSAQRVAEYLAAYSAEFRPARGMSRAAWQEQRRERLSSPAFIRVSLDEITVTVQGAARATVDFTQRYESDLYRDTVRKRLSMARQADAWRIVREESSPWPAAMKR